MSADLDVIDIHVHPVSYEMVQNVRNLRVMERTAACLVKGSAVATLLDRMNAGGIRKACLMGPNPTDGIALTNETVRSIVESHPDRFVGFVGVDPSVGISETRAEIRRAVDQWGFKGVAEIGGGDILASHWNVVYETCLDEGIPVLVHAGIPLPSMSLKHSHPFAVDELAQRYPELQIIAAHAGFPWIMETISVAIRQPNVHIDLSALPAFNRMLVKPLLGFCVDHGLEDQILFGSDFPMVDPAAYVQSLRKMSIPFVPRWLFGLPKISREVRQKVLSDNAARLLQL
ncbi:MAG: amidohydrolase family protein [Thermoguttaceae bacterium]